MMTGLNEAQKHALVNTKKPVIFFPRRVYHMILTVVHIMIHLSFCGRVKEEKVRISKEAIVT
jgi:hypothetical protein